MPGEPVLLPQKKLYLSKKKTWEDFKLRILKIFKDGQESIFKFKDAYLDSITKEDIRLWSCSLSQVDSI